MRVRYRRESDQYFEADLRYEAGADGMWRVVGGSLPGSGFTEGCGITVPEEIEGADVTELDEVWTKGDLDFIDGRSLRRAAVDIFCDDSAWPPGHDCVRVGAIYAPLEHLKVTCNLPLRIALTSDTLRSVMIAAPSIVFDDIVRCPNLESAYVYGSARGGHDNRNSERPASQFFADCPKLATLDAVS